MKTELFRHYHYWYSGWYPLNVTSGIHASELFICPYPLRTRYLSRTVSCSKASCYQVPIMEYHISNKEWSLGCVGNMIWHHSFSGEETAFWCCYVQVSSSNLTLDISAKANFVLMIVLSQMIWLRYNILTSQLFAERGIQCIYSDLWYCDTYRNKIVPCLIMFKPCQSSISHILCICAPVSLPCCTED